ncbi:MAG: glycosyltransferase family 2 protein [Nanoarchaeota archaeon]|nr:glycosyltransferase family 2 protein [Nanoarchaeota archaeon]
MKEKNNISCIIPAYNEGKRIERVLKVIQNHPSIKEIIAINDGSTDNTAQIIKKFRGIKLINLKQNRGKASALAAGIKMAKYSHLLFIDADLLNLRKKDISNLIAPIKKNEADVSLSLRKNAPLHFKLIGLDFLSGERTIPKCLFRDLEELERIPGWGIEVYMNKQIVEKKLRIKVVNWNRVISPYPSVKFGFVKGNIRLLSMILQIMRTIGVWGMPLQIMKMLRLKVK